MLSRTWAPRCSAWNIDHSATDSPKGCWFISLISLCHCLQRTPLHTEVNDVNRHRASPQVSVSELQEQVNSAISHSRHYFNNEVRNNSLQLLWRLQYKGFFLVRLLSNWGTNHKDITLPSVPTKLQRLSNPDDEIITLTKILRHSEEIMHSWTAPSLQSGIPVAYFLLLFSAEKTEWERPDHEVWKFWTSSKLRKIRHVS